jgi:hypothetical protein
MPFCTSCGNDVSDGGQFCKNCGKPIQSGSTAEPNGTVEGSPVEVPIAKAKKPIPKKLVIFGGGGVLAAILVVVLVIALTPFKLTATQAEERLLSSSDFEFSVKTSDEQTPLTEANYPFIGMGEQCGPEMEAKDIVDTSGSELAYVDYVQDDVESGVALINEDVLVFDSEEDVNKIIELVRSTETETTDCNYDNTSDGSHMTATLMDFGTTQAVYGVGGSTSVAFWNDVVYDSNDDSWDFHWKTYKALVGKGKYLIYVTGMIDADGEVGEAEIKAIITKALNKLGV